MRVTLKNRQRSHRRAGFTLVELLMVVLIVGILAGLIVPAVNIALKSVRRRAIMLEVTTLADAIEKYRQKYGDYPPDGSSPTVMARHLRKAFPNIAPTELSIFSNAYGGVPVANVSNGAPSGVMDPAEALVFFLGGFSDDPVFPITGVGGPLFLTNSAGTQVNSSGTIARCQYNTDRLNALFDFKANQLTIDNTTTTVSSDESLYFGGANDCMPTYHPAGKKAPFVYFDSRTYTFPAGSSLFFNYYSPTAEAMGVARPYRSDMVDKKVPSTAAMANAYYQFMNKSSFQLISAGLDDTYGGVPYTSGGGPVYYSYPSGQSIDFGPFPGSVPIVGAQSGYREAGQAINNQADNAVNFASDLLGDEVPAN